MYQVRTETCVLGSGVPELIFIYFCVLKCAHAYWNVRPVSGVPDTALCLWRTRARMTDVSVSVFISTAP